MCLELSAPLEPGRLLQHKQCLVMTSYELAIGLTSARVQNLSAASGSQAQTAACNSQADLRGGERDAVERCSVFLGVWPLIAPDQWHMDGSDQLMPKVNHQLLPQQRLRGCMGGSAVKPTAACMHQASGLQAPASRATPSQRA